MSLLSRLDSLVSLISTLTNSATDDSKQTEAKTNTPPEHLQNLQSFVIQEDLLQSEDLVAFKGYFEECEQTQPSIVKVRPSKPKAAELKQYMKAMRLKSAGRFGKGFGFYKASCLTTKSFNVDVIHPFVEPDGDETETEEQKAQRLQDQQKVFDKFYQRLIPKKSYMVRETPEMYQAVTVPYIDSIPSASVQWVYDILDGKREANRVITNDPDEEMGFVTNLDSKWKTHPNVDKVPRSEWKNAESIATSFYVLSLVRDRKIRSIRDLNGSHVKLLENLLYKTTETVQELYGLKKHQLRIFVHYHPQYWHFHVHFTSMAVDFGINVGKAIMLEDIIDNLKRDGEYYKKASLSCVVLEGDRLLEAL